MTRPAGWRLVGWVLLPLAAAVQQWTPPGVAERCYAARVYPHVAAALAAVNAPIPFSLAEALLAILLLGACAAGAQWAIGALGPQARRTAPATGTEPARVRRGTAILRRIGSIGLGALAAAGYALFLFTASWGLNYRRPPLAQRLSLAPGGTTEELLDTARWLLAETSALAPAGPAGLPTRLPYSRAELDARVEAAYARLGSAGGLLTGRFGRAKPVFSSGALSRLGISGIYTPWTGEPNYNRHQPDSELVFSVAHEKAHQRGVASENEASFVAFLALSASDDPYLRYCGFLNAGSYVLGAVSRADPASRPKAAALLSSRPRADLRQAYEFWRRYRGPARKLSRRVNDLYLRANKVPGGIRSYDAVTDLLVAYRRAHAESIRIPVTSASSPKSKREE